MFGTLKQVIGLVGVTVELEVEQYLPTYEPMLRGVVHLHTKREQQISEVKITLVHEVHKSGGRYPYNARAQIGEVTVTPTPALFKAGEARPLTFVLPFERPQSRAEEGGLSGLVARVSAQLNESQECYWVSVKAKVKGAVRHPHDRKQLLTD
ncbi:MAG: sporulation protein [Chloroflexota bacterium]